MAVNRSWKDNMSPLDVVGLGLSTVDILMRLSEMPTWEQGGGMRDVCFDGGGPVGTALAAAARLGARAGYVGTCGSDAVAALRLQYLTRDGIDVSRVITRGMPEKQVILVYVQAESGERVFAAAHIADDLLKPEELDREYITSAPFLHLDGFHLEAAFQAARWMREAGKTVVLDAGKTRWEVSQGMASLVDLTDILICGSGFGPALTGRHDIWDAGEGLLARGPRVVVQTEGAAGCYTTTASERFHTPAFKVDVVDTTGAGDVFHGAYIFGLLQGWDCRRTARFATAVSAIKCTRLGGRSGIPGLGEVQKFLELRGKEIE
jgi:sulfofructose kinase